MSAFLNNIVQKTDDFIWNALAENIPPAIRSNTGFLNFACPMCMDYKERCGISRSSYIGINCYNCGFATAYKAGGRLSFKMQEFLKRIGLSDREVGQLKHQAMVVSRALESVDHIPESVAGIMFDPSFDTMELPGESHTLDWWADHGCDDKDFLAVADYACSRGDTVLQHGDFHWSPVEKFKRKLIIPFRFRGRIVGFTERAIDPDGEKYLNHMQPNYLFNNHVLENDREVVLIVEGPLDAIAIDGCSPLGAKLNAQQIKWIKTCGKTPVVVPDRDKSGLRLIKIARENNFHVAFPGLGSHHGDWWDEDIKDCDEAVKRHGRLYAIQSIMNTMTNNATEIELKKKYFIGGTED